MFSIPELMYKNEGVSSSKGTVSNGTLENAYLIPFRGNNFTYFSFWSYYIMNNAYVNHKVFQTVKEAYQTLESESPGRRFYIMECSDKHGGKLKLHKTHQNGLSIDFLVPKKSKIWFTLDHFGLLHYLLEFDKDGKCTLNDGIQIDFETMGKHILSLDNAAKKNGLMISKVILKIDLKDDLFKTKSGKEILNRNIYFAKVLPEWTDRMHDDHYHIDFKIVQ